MTKPRHTQHRRRAFTLLEVIVVVTIIALLATLVASLLESKWDTDSATELEALAAEGLGPLEPMDEGEGIDGGPVLERTFAELGGITMAEEMAAMLEVQRVRWRRC